jgi:hypothetical protein
MGLSGDETMQGEHTVNSTRSSPWFKDDGGWKKFGRVERQNW